MSNCTITKDNGTYKLNGVMTFATVPQLLAESADWIRSDPEQSITIDLADISKADSAGLALMTEWVRLANKNGHQLNFTHIPDQLNSLIRISELESLFSL